ncbi:hypothetical protein CP061683_1259B, partial [Chlamydia psittaci 06-1683]
RHLIKYRVQRNSLRSSKKRPAF